eukprot:241222_1
MPSFNYKPQSRTIEQDLICGFIQQCKLSIATVVSMDIVDLIILFYFHEEEHETIVIDSGSEWIKAGFAGEEDPRAVFPSIVAQPKHTTPNTYATCLIGREVQLGRTTLKLSVTYPIEHGIVCDWKGMKAILHHVYKNELQYLPRQVLMSEAPLTPKANRERMTQLTFESFRANKFYVAIDAVLALYASGRTTGVVWSHGHTVGHIVPIYEGYSLAHCVQRYDIGGLDMTQYLMKSLSEKGYSLDKDVVTDIKEKLCYVALDFETEMMKYMMYDSSDVDCDYELPDGQVITIGRERFRATETILQPSLVGRHTNSAEGMCDLLSRAIVECNAHIRKTLYHNVVLCGGNTMFDGLPERIEKELRSLYPQWPFRIHAPPERQYSTWVGGSILASLCTFEEMWITKREYEEYGPAIVHRKCT